MDANIQKYQAFVEVADAGSFTKAAETLAYSQSGISHMVSDLEQRLGRGAVRAEPPGGGADRPMAHGFCRGPRPLRELPRLGSHCGRGAGT